MAAQETGGGPPVSTQPLSDGVVIATGSTTGRTLADRAADVISVLDFGAAGDGVADDTAEIQAAATAAGGKRLVFPAGSYAISEKITLLGSTEVEALGTVIITQSGAGKIVFYGSAISNVSITGFTLIGAGSATQPPGHDTWAAITFETSGAYIRVTGNTISGFYNGITATSIGGVTIRDNDVSSFLVYGVLTSVSDDFHIDNNVIHDSDQTGAANSYGISASGGRPGSLQSNNTIVANKIRNIEAWDGIMTHDCDGLLIALNDIRGVRNGLDIGANGAGNYADKVTVVGNYIEGTATDTWSGAAAFNAGIGILGVDAGTAARNVSVVGNVVKGFNVFNTGSQAAGGIVLIYVDGVTVSGNRVYDTGTFANTAGGIVVNGAAAGVTLSGNSVKTGNGLPPVLLVNVTGDSLAVTGNHLVDGNGTAYAVRVSGTTLSMLNVVGNSTSASSPFLATTSTITGTRVDWLEDLVSADRGDTSQTLAVRVDLPVQRWATTLGANRTVTLSTTDAGNGDAFRVVRTGLGAFTLDVGGLKTIPNSTAAFVDVTFDGSAWQLTGYGAL